MPFLVNSAGSPYSGKFILTLNQDLKIVEGDTESFKFVTLEPLKMFNDHFKVLNPQYKDPEDLKHLIESRIPFKVEQTSTNYIFEVNSFCINENKFILNLQLTDLEDFIGNFWKSIYLLSVNSKLQTPNDSYFESIGRILIRETNYDAFHWRWSQLDSLIPSRHWIFKKLDPNPELTKKLNDSENLFSNMNPRPPLEKGKSQIISFSENELEPYKHSLCFPLYFDHQLIAVIELFSTHNVSPVSPKVSSFGDAIQSEIQRQMDLFRGQEKEKNEVVQLAQASRLSSLGAIAGGIAHEINNPLTIIMGMLKMTIKELMSDHEIQRDKLSEILDKARLHTERISKIIKGIRALSRDGSRDPFILSNIQDMIDNTVALCESSLKTNNVSLTFKIDDPELLIQCRPVQLSQVLLNLITNSIDAIGEQPHPWIQLQITKTSNNSVEFSVTDSGDGIPESIASQLMQPFFTTKGTGKGTGLGLSISQEIIKAHFGTFSLDRTCPNTRFVFIIPVEQNSIKSNVG